MVILRLALHSLLARRLTALLTVLAIALSVALLLGVEKVRTGAQASFADTISGTDLIMGARSGPVQLLLYSVFRIGHATNNITWESYQDIAARPEIDWIVPLSLGDSHRGYRVLGTDPRYFEHYRYRSNRPLRFQSGQPFDDLYDAVLGADVAAALGYGLGDPLVVSHGLGRGGFAEHDDKPFRVSGILEKTGTPVDRTVHVSLEAIEAIHLDWQDGAAPARGAGITAEEARQADLTPKAITAALIGLKSRLQAFTLQRVINEYRPEPLTAILPGVALQELWSLVATAEVALAAVSLMVVATAFLGMITMILAGLNERRREMAILRAVGARPRTVFGLLIAEAGLLALAGTALGLVLLWALLALLQPLVDSRFGLYLPLGLPTAQEWMTLGIIVSGGILAGFVPAALAYRRALADGLTLKV